MIYHNIISILWNYISGIGTTCKHGDFYTCPDRFSPGELKLTQLFNKTCHLNFENSFEYDYTGKLQPHKFENAMTLDKQSWGHREDAKLEDFLTSEELIRGKLTNSKFLNENERQILILMQSSWVVRLRDMESR